MLAMRLQQSILQAAFVELGLTGPSRFPAWCQGLGRLGISSADAEELFHVLGAPLQRDEVSPETFADAVLAQEALSFSIQCTLDLARILQLRYKMLLFGCRSCLGLNEASALGSVQLLKVCEQLQLVVTRTDVEELHKELLARGGPASRGFEPHTEVGAPTLMLGPMCQLLAVWSTSAAKLHGGYPSSASSVSVDRDSSTQTPPPTLGPLKRRRSSRHPPAAYVGKTPVEIIVRFKDPAFFPWHRLPETASGRRFEELWCLSVDTGHEVATEVVELLTDRQFDRAR